MGGTREEPCTLTQVDALFSLVPLVWESNPKLQGGWCKTHTLQQFSTPPREVMCVYFSSTYYKAVRVGGGGEGEGHVPREDSSPA